MTFEDVLKACSGGKMPKVISNAKTRTNRPIGNTGIITTIKDNGKHRGVGVKFTGIEWEVWFTDSNDTDKRTRYLRDLSIID